MPQIKNQAEQNIMRKSGQILGTVLAELREITKPGVKTIELDKYAEKRIIELGGTPGFKGYMGFPCTLCTSINDEVVHTIPSDRVIQPGDIVSIDCGVKIQGYNTDAAITVLVPPIKPEVQIFYDTAVAALEAGIKAAIPGNSVKDISQAIQTEIIKKKYGIIKELTGHGVGKELHEEPCIPNFVENGRTTALKAGMALAIEPIFSMGSGKIRYAKDGWNIITTDGKPAIQIEHTVLVTDKNPEIITKNPKKKIENNN